MHIIREVHHYYLHVIDITVHDLRMETGARRSSINRD